MCENKAANANSCTARTPVLIRFLTREPSVSLGVGVWAFCHNALVKERSVAVSGGAGGGACGGVTARGSGGVAVQRPSECSHGRRRWEEGQHGSNSFGLDVGWLYSRIDSCNTTATSQTCCSNRRKGVNIFMRNPFYPTLRGHQRPAPPICQTLHAQAPQHAAEVSMAELHAAILDRAAVRPG